MKKCRRGHQPVNAFCRYLNYYPERSAVYSLRPEDRRRCRIQTGDEFWQMVYRQSLRFITVPGKINRTLRMFRANHERPGRPGCPLVKGTGKNAAVDAAKSALIQSVTGCICSGAKGVYCSISPAVTIYRCRSQPGRGSHQTCC